MPGYRIYRTLRADGRHSGGIAIYTKHHIPHYQIQRNTCTDIEYTSLILSFLILTLTLTSIYAPSTGDFPANSIMQLFSQHQCCFLVDDYNAKSRR